MGFINVIQHIQEDRCVVVAYNFHQSKIIHLANFPTWNLPIKCMHDNLLDTLQLIFGEMRLLETQNDWREIFLHFKPFQKRVCILYKYVIYLLTDKLVCCSYQLNDSYKTIQMKNYTQLKSHILQMICCLQSSSFKEIFERNQYGNQIKSIK